MLIPVRVMGGDFLEACSHHLPTSTTPTTEPSRPTVGSIVVVVVVAALVVVVVIVVVVVAAVAGSSSPPQAAATTTNAPTSHPGFTLDRPLR